MAVASLQHHTLSLRGAFAALDIFLSSLRYVATPVGRDPRLDLLRGFCVFAMIVDHIGGTSWLYAVTGGNSGTVTAAEGFVFLSGLVLGIVSRRRMARDGLRAAIRSVLARAWTLYGLTVSLTLIFVGLTVGTDLAIWVDRSMLGEIRSWPELVASVVLLRFTWHGTDILALYALLLAVSPLALFLLDERRPWHLLAGSWTLWLLYQCAPEQMIVPWPIEHAATFPFAAWQVLFTTALVLGYYRSEIGAWLARESERPHGAGLSFRVGLGAAACGLVLLGAVLTTDQAHAMGQAVPSLASLDSIDLFDKAGLGIGRLAMFASIALLVYGLLTLSWRPVERTVGWVLIPLGQASLYAYAVHLFMILVAYNVPPYVGSVEEGLELHNTIGQIALVLAIWVMVRRRMLFGLIPR